ncbi:MAG TPA: hypothetical protein PKJ30_14650, partial [Leptospiraceae bacterium]|nr:hypothetical protein [Leptospiraceae bacterium]
MNHQKVERPGKIAFCVGWSIFSMLASVSSPVRAQSGLSIQTIPDLSVMTSLDTTTQNSWWLATEPIDADRETKDAVAICNQKMIDRPALHWKQITVPGIIERQTNFRGSTFWYRRLFRLSG